jgi:hypothetical protein
VELLKFVQYSGELSTDGSSDMSVSAAMDFVNQYRIDAHAKNISDGDYERLIRSLELLESIFLPPP